MGQYLRATVFDGGVACVELVTLLREAPHERLVDDWDVMAAGAAALRGEAGRGGKAGGGEVSVAASTTILSDRDPAAVMATGAGALFGHGVRSAQAVLVERAVVEPDKPVFAFLYKLGDPLHYRHEEVLVRLLGECGLKLGDERLELHAVVLVDGEHDVLLLRSHAARLRLRLLVCEVDHAFAGKFERRDGRNTLPPNVSDFSSSRTCRGINHNSRNLQTSTRY